MVGLVVPVGLVGLVGMVGTVVRPGRIVGTAVLLAGRVGPVGLGGLPWLVGLVGLAGLAGTVGTAVRLAGMVDMDVRRDRTVGVVLLLRIVATGRPVRRTSHHEHQSCEDRWSPK